MTNKDPNNRNLSEPLQLALLDILNQVEREDSWVRKLQIRQWKKYERFWHGIQYIYWSESQQDWMATADSGVNSHGQTPGEDREGSEGPFYDYVINFYKAHGESVIAALAAQLPSVRFPPDDADNEDDRLTSQTYGKISDLIDRHNQSRLLIFQTLLSLWNQGIVCAYHCSKADKKYGMLKIPNYKPQMSCDGCGYIATKSNEIDCPSCLVQTPIVDEDGNESKVGDPQKLKEDIVMSGYTESPKSRVLISIFGPMFVKISHYAKDQSECGYLCNSMEQPKSLLKNIFCLDKETGSYDDKLADEIDSAGGQFDLYERVGRSPSSYSYAIYDNPELVTLKRVWLRPYEYERLPKSSKEEKKQLYKLFPDGCYVAFAGDKVYLEARNESLDDYWTIGQAGLSTYIHSDPLGQPLVPLQEMKNTLSNLTVETAEQSIADIYADPEVIDFEDYSQHEKRPGALYAAVPRPGKNLSDSFYEGPKATLSKEVPDVISKVEEDAQFVVGSFPSIYGGPQETSSRTASQYNMSRQMALQRLSITWSLLTIFWAKLKERCVKLYVANVVADEKFAQKDDSGNYVNVWIRKSDLMGKVGEVEPEGAETFPVTMAQKQSLLLQLLQLNNPDINALISNPENAKTSFDALGFPELKMPQDDQRIKQVRETQQMLQSGQLVQIEPEIDDDAIHIQTLKDYLVGNDGQDLKTTNPGGYQLNMEHLQLHQQNQQMQANKAAVAAGAQLGGANNNPNGQPQQPGPVQPPAGIPGTQTLQ